MIMLRFGLELAWLVGLVGLTPAAASVLAGRAAGLFAAMPGTLPIGTSPPPAFASLTGSIINVTLLRSAAGAFSLTHDGPAELTIHDLANIEALWPLAAPTEYLLASGGDERLTLACETGLNRYGCTPWPQPQLVSFGSCTASCLSVEAFDAAEQSRQTLAATTVRTAPSVALAEASDAIGAALLALFDIADLAEAVLAASGTDAALVVTGLLAAERPGQKLTSILMSPSETGSGVPDAVQGRHFATSAAAGCKVGKGQPIEGLMRGPDLISVALRHNSGAPRSGSHVRAECEQAIQAGIAAGHVVLHAIDGSKTGLTAPDRATCRYLARKYGKALDIVVDACQARIEPALVRWYVSQGFPVLITGSKFFAAPGFCGAVLFPRSRLRRIARDGRLPPGLAPYARLEDGFGSRRCPGLILRWRAALHQMTAFNQLQRPDIRHGLDVIGACLLTELARQPRLGLIEACRPLGFGWSGRRSVFTFAVRKNNRWMSAAELRCIYTAMSDDADPLAWAAQRGPSSPRCQIGQPVSLGGGEVGGLRIAISAGHLVEGGDQASGLSEVFNRLSLLMKAHDKLPADESKTTQEVWHSAQTVDPRVRLTG